MFQDKTLICKECGEEFVFTAGEQEFYEEKGLKNEPSRCGTCRHNSKNALRGARQMYDAVCAQCGAPTQVPFQPKEDRPVYCDECYKAMRG